MEQPEFTKSRNNDLYLAGSCFQEKAQRELVQSFLVFDDAFKDVGFIYLSGRPPDGNREFPLISNLIGRQADLIIRADRYRQTLALLQSFDVRIPSGMLVAWIHAFLKLIRHCADYSRWHLFDELDRRTRDCLEFIARERTSHCDTQTFTSHLQEDVGGILQYLMTTIREAVIRRENDIMHGIAKCMPNPDFDGQFSSQAREFGGTLQVDEKLDFIYRYVRDESHPREMACRLVNEIRNDPNLHLSRRLGRACSFPEAVRYIRSESRPVEHYRGRIEKVREMATAAGQDTDKFYRSLIKQAERLHRNPRPKKRVPSAPPGPCPIPDRSWAACGGGMI